VKIAVLGSSRPVAGEPEYEAARETGREIARHGAAVVCGGYAGVMEAVCRGAAEANGKCVGIVLAGRGEPNRWVSLVEAAADLSDRLRRIRDAGSAWIFLPRGLGTLLEIVWISESIAKGEVPPRPMVFLGTFWKAAVEMVTAEAVGPGAQELRRAIRWADTPRSAVDAAMAEIG
jgi:uncharacterized protein (TIGR00725 family)